MPAVFLYIVLMHRFGALYIAEEKAFAFKKKFVYLISGKSYNYDDVSVDACRTERRTATAGGHPAPGPPAGCPCMVTDQSSMHGTHLNFIDRVGVVLYRLSWLVRQPVPAEGLHSGPGSLNSLNAVLLCRTHVPYAGQQLLHQQGL